MKLRHPWLIRLAARLAAVVIRLWLATLRRRIDFGGAQRHPADPDRERFIYGFWHENLLAGITFRGRITALISQHADGELITLIARDLGFGAARGSTTRGGAQGLLDLWHHSRRSHLTVTPDGPRGPRRRVQAGLIFLAARTGLPIVVFGVGYSWAWRASSWDRFAVPWPGSTLYCVAAPPIRIPPDVKRDGLERYRQMVEDQLEEVTEAAERWAARSGKRQPGRTSGKDGQLRASA
jgi:lysophospholipid acyltransferase (LPLAT)-like uncharacterized protein